MKSMLPDERSPRFYAVSEAARLFHVQDSARASKAFVREASLTINTSSAPGRAITA